jgi:hypothetical protein
VVTAVARLGTAQYAFYRGTNYIGQPPQPANPPAAPASAEGQSAGKPMDQSLDANLKMQNSANEMRQIERLQQRYNPPAEMRKGAPAGEFR